MKKFIVELRDNRFGVTEADPCVGYLGLVGDPHEDARPIGCVSDRSGALEYDTATQHRYDTRNLSDAFFDRYFITVVATKAFDETAEAFEEAMNNPSND